jgi:iron complex outermembrane recepter protein
MKNLAFYTALTGGLLSSTAFAQNEETIAGLYTGDELVVTAQRREQSPQDVGIALSVFSGGDLIDLGIDQINGLENAAPNLEIENQFGSGQPSFSIRGVGFRDYATNNTPTVGIYVDDVAYPVPVMTQGVLFDVDRVEILRGPQGTLYGRNTTGGAIKVISARPTDEMAAGLTVEGGRFGRVDAEGYVSGPVSESVRVRLSGATKQGGAWQINRETGEKIGDAEQYALRGLVAVDIAPEVDVLFNLHGFIDRSDGLGLQLFNDSLLDPTALAHTGQRETSFGSSSEFATLIGITPGQHPFRDNEGWGANLTLNAGLGGATLTYIGGVETLNRKEFNDFDALTLGGAGVYFESSVDVITQELRLSGETDRLRWVGGLYYSNEDLNEVYQSDFAASFGPGFAVTTPYNQDARTLAAYLHTDFNITDAITIIAGIRYEDEERNLNDLGTFATGFSSFNFANGTLDGTLESRSLKSDNVSGKLGVEMRPSNDVLLYASYSRGVKSGGFTAYNTLNPNALTPFTPEKLNAYEAGFKTDAANGALRLNGAVFYYDYTDQQVQSAIFDPATSAIVGRIVNAPKSKIYGAELELLWRPAQWLTLGQTLGYKEGEFKEFTDLDTGTTGASGMEVTVDRAGQDLGFPNLSYQGFITAETPIADMWVVRARFDYSYRDDLALPLLGEAYRVDDYWLANTLIAIRPDNDRWEFALWARNIFNTRYDETRNFFIAPGGVADVAAPARPATYGARISLRY